jgi:hypothetical protein
LGESHHPMHIRSFEFCHCYCHRNTCHELHANHQSVKCFQRLPSFCTPWNPFLILSLRIT